MSLDPEKIRETVRKGYAAVAKNSNTGCCSNQSCCGTDSNTTADVYAQILGYDANDLEALPDGANLGLSCGNPLAMAYLTEGLTVMDLGSGAGFDAFLAARRVGPTGHVIGVDMTPEMISRARQNARAFSERTGLNTVEFRLGEIEHLPCGNDSVDVVISNCVINLSPNKPQVWREIARVLKPGGRAAVSDIALLKPLPDPVRSMTEALVGCVAGAVLISETEQMIRESGLLVEQKKTHSAFLDAIEETSPEAFRSVKNALPAGTSLRDFIISLEVVARKPLTPACCC